jgi:hypothetical protein
MRSVSPIFNPVDVQQIAGLFLRTSTVHELGVDTGRGEVIDIQVRGKNRGKVIDIHMIDLGIPGIHLGMYIGLARTIYIRCIYGIFGR